MVWFPSLDELIDIHGLVMENAGRPPQPVIRPDELLSGLARPQFLHRYGESDIIMLGVALATAITEAHGFQDGNKRTAFAALDTFLDVNGVRMIIDDDDTAVEDLLVQLSDTRQPDVTQDDLQQRMAAHIRQHAIPVDPPSS